MMIFELNFLLKEKRLPLEYRKAIMSFLKQGISSNSEKMFEKYYGSTNKKQFTFYSNIPNIKIQNGSIISSDNNFSIIIKTNDMMLGHTLYNACFSMRNKIFNLENDNFMILTNIVKKNDFSITKPVLLCKTMSPIYVADHNETTNKTHMISIREKDYFIDAIKDKYSLNFTPIDCRKGVVRHQGLNLETTSGVFMLEGNVENLRNAFYCGLGSRTGEGFGSFRVIEQGDIICD